MQGLPRELATSASTPGFVHNIEHMDNLTPEQRSEAMRRVKSANTKPEVEVGKIVRKMGVQYKRHSKRLPGCPDLVFPKLHKVIFVHGCFWHQHSCSASALPESNRQYWESKQFRNRARDKRNVRKLRRMGWKILVIWECQLKSAAKVRSRICRFLSWRPE